MSSEGKYYQELCNYSLDQGLYRKWKDITTK